MAMDIWATLCFFHERWLQKFILLSGGHTAGIASLDLEPRAWHSGTTLAAAHLQCRFHTPVSCLTFSVYFRKKSVPVSDHRGGTSLPMPMSYTVTPPPGDRRILPPELESNTALASCHDGPGQKPATSPSCSVPLLRLS